MTLRSVELKTGRTTGRTDVTLMLGSIAAWLVTLSFGGVIWAINGGFSVLGFREIAGMFNEAGRLFWSLMASLTFTVPVTVPGLSSTQPLLPWVGVVAASLLQVAVVWRKLQGKPIPLWLVLFTSAVSIYDYATTFFGLGTAAWVQQAGRIFQGFLALVLTFIVEVVLGWLLGWRAKDGR